MAATRLLMGAALGCLLGSTLVLSIEFGNGAALKHAGAMVVLYGLALFAGRKSVQ